MKRALSHNQRPPALPLLVQLGEPPDPSPTKVEKDLAGATALDKAGSWIVQKQWFSTCGL